MSVDTTSMTPSELRSKYPHASESFIRRNAGLEPDQDNPIRISSEALQQSVVAGIRPTTDLSNLNKLEAEYLRWLEGLGDHWICVQAITLKIGHDCRLTMDFWALNQSGLRAIDTKATNEKTGKPLVEEDAMIKMRVASRLFPFVRFLIAWKKGGVWEHTEVKP